ncbi:uncharacterized protein RAG0_12928 [Rhynchosporium agropyri]|uniref:Uncharacterized protein n=1 Tax=Rhynchosporium agropyri TaxID=914238 RepID=A0A1E1LCQ5_9HELO|nr:uncharacterized protein RAG0_12928 [Rhynchosporium agropyri]
MDITTYNKENVAPVSCLPSPPTSFENKPQSIESENHDGFIEIPLTSDDDQINNNLKTNLSSANIQAAEKRDGELLSDDDEAAEKRKRVFLSNGDDDDKEDTYGLRSMDSLTAFGHVEMEELLEIERSIPDNHEDLDLNLNRPDPPERPHTPFENQSPRFQSPLIEFQPLTISIPPFHSEAPRPQTRRSDEPSKEQSQGLQSEQLKKLLCLDLSALPKPLNIKKSSYFSQGDPTKTESKYDDESDSDNDSDTDDWSEEEEEEEEEGKIVDDGIRREFVEISREEWNLRGHPRFGKYRVKEISCLRVCATIRAGA